MLLFTLWEDLKMKSCVSQGDREEIQLDLGCDEPEISIEEYKKEEDCSLPRDRLSGRGQWEAEAGFPQRKGKRCVAHGTVSTYPLASENALRSNQTQEKG